MSVFLGLAFTAIRALLFAISLKVTIGLLDRGNPRNTSRAALATGAASSVPAPFPFNLLIYVAVLTGLVTYYRLSLLRTFIVAVVQLVVFVAIVFGLGFVFQAISRLGVPFYAAIALALMLPMAAFAFVFASRRSARRRAAQPSATPTAQPPRVSIPRATALRRAPNATPAAEPAAPKPHSLDLGDAPRMLGRAPGAPT